jgi:protein-S-isoprenylcysteine O-methyltransferase Ste14
MNFEYKAIIFVLASIGIVWVSRSSLRNFHSHGFYRFFAWEVILVLFLMNVNYWFLDPFSLNQIFSWIFLLISLVLIIRGVQLFQEKGKLDSKRNDPSLVGIEKTTELVTNGIYHYIRHPFYSSLLFLGWGIFLKHVSWVGFILALIVTILLTITAKKEEVENIHFFGEEYQMYMKQTKMFVPFIF